MFSTTIGQKIMIPFSAWYVSFEVWAKSIYTWPNSLRLLLRLLYLFPLVGIDCIIIIHFSYSNSFEYFIHYTEQLSKSQGRLNQFQQQCLPLNPSFFPTIDQWPPIQRWSGFPLSSIYSFVSNSLLASCSTRVVVIDYYV